MSKRRLVQIPARKTGSRLSLSGRQFEERVTRRSADLEEDELRRLRMDLVSGVVVEFARIEAPESLT